MHGLSACHAGARSPECSVPPEAIARSGSMLLQRTLSGSMIVLWLGSVLMTVAQVATKGRVDVCGPVLHPEAMWMSVGLCC